MKQQDKLRTTLREYYDNQQVPFSDNEWEQARTYLEAARRGRRKRYVLPILLLLVLGASLLWFNFSGHIAKKNIQASQPVKSKTNPIASSQVKAFSLQKGEELKTNRKSRSHYNTRSTSNPASFISTPTDLSKIHSELQSKRIQSKTPEPFKSELVSEESDLSKQSYAKNEMVLNSPDTINLRSALSEAINNEDHGQSRHEESITLVKEHIETKPIKPEDTAQGQDLPPLKDEGAVSVLALPKTIETRDLNAIGEKILTKDTTRLETTLQTIAIILDTLKSSYSDGITLSKEDIVADTLSSSLTNNPIARDGFFYELGAIWTYGWKGQQKRDARGFSPALGINYINRLSNRCAFSFGVQYLQVNNLTNSSKISRVSSYTYGEQSNVTVITPSSLHYILAPLRFHYFVTHKTSFGAGVNLAYLLNVDATVTTYDEKPGFNSNYKTIKQSGYSKGFTWFDSQLAFWYQRRILPSLAIQAEIFIGLTDVKQDEFFGLSQKERNSGVKLSLIYYAFRKTERK